MPPPVPAPAGRRHVRAGVGELTEGKQYALWTRAGNSAPDAPREVIVAVVQMARDLVDVILVPLQHARRLPAPHLLLEGVLVGRLLLVAPMHLRRVAGNAMRRVEEFAARRGVRRVGKGHGAEQRAGCEQHPASK